MTTTTTGFRVQALSGTTLDRVRATGLDASGHPVERVLATGGEPLRCCLRDAHPDELIMLFGYEPPLPVSPYREIGAVFAHATPCGGPEHDRYPDGWRGRAQVLRAYDRRGRIHPVSRMHDGGDPEAVIAAMFADPAVVRIHSRNVAYGCFMFAVDR